MSTRVQRGEEGSIARENGEEGKKKRSAPFLFPLIEKKEREKRKKERMNRVFRVHASSHSTLLERRRHCFCFPVFVLLVDGRRHVARRGSSRARVGFFSSKKRRRRERLGRERRRDASAAAFAGTLCAAAIDLDLLALALLRPRTPYLLPRRRRPAPHPRLPRPRVALGGRSDEPEDARAGQRPSLRQGTLEGEEVFFFRCSVFFLLSSSTTSTHKTQPPHSLPSPLSLLDQAFYSQRWRPSDEDETAPWRLRYSRRLRAAAALGAPRRPLADLLPGGHRGPVRAAAFSSSSGGGGGILCTGGADRRIRLWDLRCSNDDGGGGGGGYGGRGGKACAPSGELLAASAPLPGSVRCLASGSGMLVSGSGVDARLAVWRRRDQGSQEEEDERREEKEEEEVDDEEEEEGRDSDDFDDDGSEDRSLSSFYPSDVEDEGNADDVDWLSSATRRLSLQESNRKRRKQGQAAGGGAPPAASAAAADTTRRRRPAPLPPFDLSAPPTFLSGHAGPVAAVSVDDEEGLIYSASWDATVRVWDPDRRREEQEEEEEEYESANASSSSVSSSVAPHCPQPSPQCVGVVHLRDWGWSVCRRAGRLLVAEGRGAAVFDAETGKVVRRVAPSEADGGRRGDAARVEGTRDGRTLLVARADGSLESVDLRGSGGGGGKTRGGSSSTTTTALMLPGGPPPSGLAFDDPWIALASGRSGVALLDARSPRAPLATFSAAGKGKGAASGAAAATGTTAAAAAAKPALPIPRPPRRLGWSANAAVRCMEISGTWVVAGCDDGSVRTWHFGGGGAGGEGEGGGDGGRGSRRRRRRGGRGRGGGET